ncbi:NUMOD4 domain-containing protein [Yersinia enterocolitica]|nr:hypothetical protein [Yersinia enterocolitica]
MEIWKQTKYKNYEVSNWGRIRNTKTGKILTPQYRKQRLRSYLLPAYHS